MAGIMVLFHIFASHAGQSDTFSGFESILNELPLPGFSRSDWGIYVWVRLMFTLEK